MADDTMDAADDEKEEGRILDDGEYRRVLRNRNDIFLIDKQERLRILEAAALVLGVILCAWLSTMHPLKVSPDFYQNIPKERMAMLWRGPNPALPEERKPNEELEAERSSTARTGIISLPRSDKIRFKSNVLPSRVKAAVLAAPAERPAQGEDSLMRRDNTNKIEEEANLITLGNANKKQGNHSDAFAAFKRVLKQNPHNSAALAGMGDLFLQTGMLDSAADFYSAAIKENPRIADAHNGLGSVRYYLSVMAANPNYAVLNKIPDPARYSQLQYDSAIAEYTNAISIDSTRVDALTNRGVIRDSHGDRSAAIEDYTRAIKIKPTYAEAYNKRAAAYKASGRFTDAFADYTAAIKLDSGSYEFNSTLHFANAYFGRGNVQYQLGNYELAVADYDSALALEPNHPLAMLNKARALADERQYDSSIVWYTRAIAILSPKEYGGAQERAYFGRGVAYNQTDRSTPALKDFNEAIKLKPDDRYAFLHRGNAYKSLGNYDSAIADFKNALASSRLAAKCCWRIAECFSIKQNKSVALTWLKQAASYGFRDFAVWKRDKELSALWNEKAFSDLTNPGP